MIIEFLSFVPSIFLIQFFRRIRSRNHHQISPFDEKKILYVEFLFNSILLNSYFSKNEIKKRLTFPW